VLGLVVSATAAQSRTVRILIVKTSSMGDVVHALPLAADLSARLPQAQIDWLVEESFAAIPAMSRHVRRVHRVALRRWRKSPLQAGTWREIAAVKRALRSEHYDWVLDAQGLLKSAWMARWAYAPVAGPSSDAARERIAAVFYQRRIPVPRALHAVERCRRIGAGLFGYALDEQPRFDLTVVPATETSTHQAVLLANASRASKLWPEERWIGVERWLAERGLHSVLFWGAPEEEARVRRLAASMQRATVAPRSSLEAIAATLAQTQVVIGLDTGLSHLAAALGRPTVALYCDYDPALVGVVGVGPVVSLGGVGTPPAMEAVIDAARQVLDASP
jgi:heptosyltransferase-1